MRLIVSRAAGHRFGGFCIFGTFRGGLGGNVWSQGIEIGVSAKIALNLQKTET
ncbi:MAG: hypothetical protein WBE86_00320 [Candidatus Acidiferrales bacterium]